MKNVKIFESRSAVKAYICSKLITANEFLENSFYRGLIDWIIDHRAPVFFEATKEYEYSHFTQYFNLVLVRSSYTNKYLQSLYYLHDFMHMIFRNPIPPQKLSFEQFCNVTIQNEYLASNETELLVYLRMPGIREHTVQETILYDILCSINFDFNVKNLLHLRKKILNQQLSSEEQQLFKQVLPFYERFSENNQLWCKLWYKYFPCLLRQPYSAILPDFSYTEKLSAYWPAMSESIYHNNLRKNLKLYANLLSTYLPVNFEYQQVAAVLEGKIILEEVASKFHPFYSRSKNIYQANLFGEKAAVSSV